jgi:hypothetical protein
MGHGLVRAFWLWYGTAAVLNLVIPQGRIFAGAVALGLIWIAVMRFSGGIRTWLIGLGLPQMALFFIVGIFFSAILMENLAINFHGDLNPNLALNTFLWLGTCLAWLLGWWLLSLLYRFTPTEVFLVSGLMGVLVEQHWLVPRLIASGQWFPVVAAAPILVPVYGVAMAPAFLLTGRGDTGATRRPGWLGYLVALVGSFAAFYIGTAIWQGVFHPLISPQGQLP